jgi:RNA polymerase sigma-70 factor (ECF subfamily)
MPLTIRRPPLPARGQPVRTKREPVLLVPLVASGGTPASDGELLDQVSSGDALAMDALVDRYHRPAVAFAARFCGVALAEDAVQDAFLSIWRASSTYRPELASVRNWLLGIVRHRAIDAVRRDARHTNRRASADLLDLLVDPVQTEDAVLASDRAGTVRSVLQRLPPEQARVITLAYFDGLTHTQIARLTGLAPGTVKGRIRLGVAKLRQPLAGGGIATPAPTPRDRQPPGSHERSMTNPGPHHTQRGSGPRLPARAHDSSSLVKGDR